MQSLPTICLQTWYSFANLADARPSRRKLEAEWHQRLKRARSGYEETVAIRQEMLAERSEWPIDLQPDPDGRFALHLAFQEESAARTEYMRVLRIFTKLILHGTPPEEDPDSRLRQRSRACTYHGGRGMQAQHEPKAQELGCHNLVLVLSDQAASGECGGGLATTTLVPARTTHWSRSGYFTHSLRIQ